MLPGSPVALLLAQIAIVLVVSRVFGFVGRRLGQPLVVAEIVAGIALGPSVLGALWPEALATIFPSESLGALAATSQLGLVLFMFVVGLEFDLGLLRNQGRLALVISQSSIIVPFVVGALLAVELHPRFAPEGVPLAAFCLFVGASMSVTAFPVLARILSERGLMATRLGALALTCAAVDDVTAWCLLAFVIAVVRSGAMWDAVATTVYAATFVGVMVGFVRPFLARVARRFGTTRGLSQTAVAAILLLLLVSAVTAEGIGIHALFGAFVYGAIMPREGNTVRVLIGRLEDVVVVLMLPLFFATTGLRTSIGLVQEAHLWGWVAIITVAATAGKFFGTLVPARLGGLSLRDGATLGVLVNTRGLVGLIILNIGLELGVVSPLLFTMMVIMAVATTLATSPLVRLLYPPHRVLAERAAARSAASGGILTAISHPDSAPSLARITAALATPGDPVWGLRLVPVADNSTIVPDAELPTENTDEDAARALAYEAGALGVRAEPLTLTSGDPAEDIAEFARIRGAALIVVGLHRPLMGSARLGGPLLRIADLADCDVAMFADKGFSSARRIVVGLGGEHDGAVRRVAARLAARAEQVIEVAPLPGRDHVQALIDAAKGADLVVIGVGATWELPMASFGLKVPKLVSDLPCALLAVSGTQT